MSKKVLRATFSPVLLLLFINYAAYSQGFEIPELDGFKKEINYPVYTPNDLWDYINGGADSYTALGFEELNIVEFTKGKKNSVKLEIYKHRNCDLTFGIYALERAPSYNFIDIGVQGYKGDGFLNFFKDEYYVKIYTHSKSKKALEAVGILAEAVEMIIEGVSKFPPGLNVLPSEGKLINEEMFISENVIGHSFLSDAFRANYMVGDKSFVIYIFDREDPIQIGEMVQKYLSKQNLDTDSQTEGKSAFKDGYNGDIFMAWKDNRFVLITGLDSDDSELADSYISKIIK